METTVVLTVELQLAVAAAAEITVIRGLAETQEVREVDNLLLLILVSLMARELLDKETVEVT